VEGERARAEIDLRAVEANYAAVKARAGKAVMAVVKADAYGHGAVEVSRRLQEAGADYLAVATPEEARTIRASGVTLPLLVMGYSHPQCAAEMAGLGVSLTVYSLPQARALSRGAGAKPVSAHFKVDTGMSRLGFTGQGELEEALRLPGLRAEGLCTHFACADEPGSPFTREQAERFTLVIESLHKKGVDFEFIHCENSAAVVNCNLPAANISRSGIALYAPACPGAKPAMRFMARVAQVKTVAEGSGVSYSRRFVATRPTRVAVIACGYADGYCRALSGKACVTLRGARAPVVGNVCMDMTMADVTDIPGVAEGDEAELFGLGVSAWELAALAGTIPYEILCSVSARVPRSYLR
jgi:alanine racemase